MTYYDYETHNTVVEVKMPSDPKIVWTPDRAMPETYGSSVGGDHQETDTWFVRFHNNINSSRISVEVYGVQDLMMEGTDSEYVERGVETLVTFDIFDGLGEDGDDPSWSDMIYDQDDPMSYENAEQSYEAARRVAWRYRNNINDFISWDGVSTDVH